MKLNGGHLLVKTLEQLGVTDMFGVPGTQALFLYHCLKDSSIQNIVSTSELSAAFSAIGYYLSSGRIAPVVVIPGPGFTHAISGLAEAEDDSIPLLLITFSQDKLPGNKFRFQKIEQENIGQSTAKEYIKINDLTLLTQQLTNAYRLAIAGEPGPVIVEIDSSLLRDEINTETISKYQSEISEIDDKAFMSIQTKLTESKKPLLFIGQGCFHSREKVKSLTERLNCPVIATASGRAVLDDNHPNLVCADFSLAGVDHVNSLIDGADFVLAMGCKFSHNGTAGFRLKIDEEKLVHVNKSEDALNVNYPASIAINSDVGYFVDSLLADINEIDSNNFTWDNKEINSIKQNIDRAKKDKYKEKFKPAENGQTIEQFFKYLNSALPENSRVVTDSGMHQMLTRINIELPKNGKLIIPSDYQSMGFGIPAGIGAKIGTEDKPVVLIVGDGSIALNGMEILTAVKEKLPITMIIFNDASLGLIKYQQMEHLKSTTGTDLANPDFELWAASIGADYGCLDSEVEQKLKEAFISDRLTVLELPLSYSKKMMSRGLRAKLADSDSIIAKSGYGILRKLKNLLTGRG